MARRVRDTAAGTGQRDLLAAAGFLAPNFLGFFLFVAFPIVFSLVLVFTNWSIKPAIETRFVGLSNLGTLLGFRAAQGGGGTGLFAGYLLGYVLFFGGVIASLVGLGRKWAGVRGAGVLLVVYGAGLVGWSLATRSSVGWALVGLSALIGAVFFLVDDDEAFSGRAMVGPGALLAGTLLVRVMHEPFLQGWEARDPFFWKYLYNTLYLMFLIPLQIAGSLGLALLLSRPLVKSSGSRRLGATAAFGVLAVAGLVGFWAAGWPDAGVLWATFWIIAAMGTGFGEVAFRTIFFLPSFTAGVAIMLLWKQMFNPEFGPLNESLRLVQAGLSLLPGVALNTDLPKWILDPHWAKPALILMGFWTLVGGTNMLIYLAGLSNVPEELYEAARIDGASRWQEFRTITWPQLAPTTFFIVIMSLIAGLQGGFEQARVMTAGGPAGATKTLSYYIYEQAFEELSLGYASAIAWTMFVLIFVLTAMNWKFGNQYVNE
ncbi:MAG: sugar ABC transporter permease [Candidatus Sumerlaeia bacterium]|nr:sugar ABC transporter permease [Candidatus Sumerlaeia bacterium]